MAKTTKRKVKDEVGVSRIWHCSKCAWTGGFYETFRAYDTEHIVVVCPVCNQMIGRYEYKNRLNKNFSQEENNVVT